MTRYARDEFDRVPETAARQGVHRAAGAPSRRKLWPILAVGIAALAIGLVSFLILPKLGFAPAGSQVSSSLQSAASPDASAGTTPSAQPSASAEPSASAKSEPSATTSPTPSSAVDKTQGIAIYNGSGTSGLAARVSSIVQSDGWTLGQVGNWGGAPQKTSVIFYAGTAQKANAEALSKLLDIPTVLDSAEFQVPVVVVLGPGFK